MVFGEWFMLKADVKPTVLVVDDSEADRVILARFLEGHGFSCEKAADGMTAEKILRARRFDVLVSDLRMPRKHGHQLIVETLERPNPPMVVAVTGLMEPKLVADLISRGVVDVVQKPVPYDMLAVKIRAMFDRRVAEAKKISAAAGAGGGRRGSDVGHVIQDATTHLREELNRVTETFKGTIASLELQKNAVETDYKDFMRLMGDLMHSGTNPGASHVSRVERLAEYLAKKLRLNHHERQNVSFAALMHDIGQFGMPDEIRMKGYDALHENERENFTHYPVIGAALLSEVKGAEAAAELVEYHAENYNGTGFPHGEKGEDIPLGSRIIRVADGLDNYFRFSGVERNQENAREHLHKEQGKYYDPRLVHLAVDGLPEFFGEHEEDNIQTVEINSVHVGTVVAENIYDKRGQFLAREGVTLSENMLNRLRQLISGDTVRVYKVAPGSEK